jgi:hypothetical protein
MDNKQFNVNGKTKEHLKLAVNLLLYNKEGKADGWYVNPDKGLVITWSVHRNYKAKPFTDSMGKPKQINADELTDILWDWLHSEEAKTIKLIGWDANASHDGSNELGWRLYTEDWGHINEGEHGTDHYSIGALTPSYLWYGK